MINPKIKSILFIDDDEVNIFVLQTKMESHAPGVKASFYENATAALEFVEDQSAQDEIINIIFLDVRMPGMSGFDFLKEYHQRNWHDDLPTKIFMLSSSVSEQDRETSLNYPAVMEFINKPLNFQKIEEISNRYF